MIKAVLFDMDGVLVDSEDLSIRIGIKYFESIGFKATKENFETHLGTGMRDFVMGTAEELGAQGVADVARADEFYRTIYHEEVKKKSIAMKGARSVVENFKKMGLKIAICSSAQSWKVRDNIAALGLDVSFFDLVLDFSWIKRNKGYPDIYIMAVAMIGTDFGDAVVIEDSPGGVEAGLRAGIRTVALTTTMTRSEAVSTGADRVIGDISELGGIKSIKELEDYLFGCPDKEILYGASYIASSGKSVRDELVARCIKEALNARESAYAPYSKYKVGAAVLSARTGKIYRGANIENSSYGATICAERNAITTALTEEKTLGIDLLVVASDDYPPAPPCAICLQVIAEFAKADTRVVLVDTKGGRLEYLFSDLLPAPFIFPSERK